MNGLKQRIIGALVLISLAVIFVPMMFDEPHDERAVRSLDIPEEPPFPEVNVPDQDESMSGVPDYRIEEVDPAPEPEIIEDPAMGTQPGGSSVSEGGAGGETVGSDEGNEVPLVSEQEADTGDGGDSAPQPQSQPDSAANQAATTPVTEDAAPAQPTAGGEGDFERSLEGAWVLQLGSFGNQDNARRLRDNVRERGYGAHLQEVVRGDQTLVRVFCGPFTEKAEAEKAKQVLDKEFGIKALVTKGEG